MQYSYPPVNEASRKVTNFTVRKNLHTPVNGVNEFVCSSVSLSVTNFDPNNLRTGKTEWANKSYPDLHYSQGDMKFATQICSGKRAI